MKRVVKLIIFVALFVCCCDVFAREYEFCELSDDYIEWSKLSKEMQKETIMPHMCKKIYTDNKTIKNNTKSFYSLGVTSLPYYNSRDYDYVTQIRNQRDVGSCWAFSASTSLETYLSKKYNKLYQFSTRHMDYSTSSIFLNNEINTHGYNRVAGTGGNYDLSLSYLVNHYGPVLESNMPFENNSNLIPLSSINGFETQVDVNGAKMYDNGARGTKCSTTEIEAIKNEIVNTGSATIGFYMTQASPYYNSSTGALYYNGTGIPNHAVVVVGWDDNYAVTNFNAANRPSAPGAWIIQNSYGSSFGNNGLNYISYEDIYVCNLYVSYQDVDLEIEDNFYSIDELFPNMSLGYYTNGVSKYYGYALNIFEKDTDMSEIIKEITFATKNPGTYKLYLYEGNLVSKGLTVSNMTEIGNGTISYEGYITHKFSTPIMLQKNTTAFSVAVYYYSDYENPVPASVKNTTKYSTINVESGKSFVSAKGTVWEDLYADEAEASIKVSTNNYYSPVLTINNSSVSYNDNALIEVYLTSEHVNNISTTIKDSNNIEITPINIDYEKTNNNYSKSIITLSPTISSGSYTITIDYDGNVVNTNVNVDITHITKISFQSEELQVEAHSCKNLPNVVFTPSTSTFQKLTWNVSNNNAYINNNQICVDDYVGQTATLTATSYNNKTTFANVVVARDYSSFDFKPNLLEVPINTEIIVSEEPVENTTKKVMLISCEYKTTTSPCIIDWNDVKIDTTVPTVLEKTDSKEFKAIALGSSYIYVSSKNGKNLYVKIDVVIPFASFDLNVDKLNLLIGETSKLTGTFLPEEATADKNLAWTSNNPSVISVNYDGSLRALSAGTATITATTQGGLSDSVTVNVTAPKTEKNVAIYFISTHGTASIEKNKYFTDEVVSINAEANEHYKINSINITKRSTGENINTLVNYNNTNKTFIMPDYDIDIDVTFSKMTYGITKESNNGVFTVVSSAAYDDMISILDIFENDGYKLNSIQILKKSDRSDITNLVNYNSNKNTFTMPDYEIIIKANYDYISIDDIPNVVVESKGYNSINISWNSIENATDYEIYYSSVGILGFTLLTTTKELNYLHTNLSINNTYYYQVKAVNKEGYFKTSNVSITKPSLSVPELTNSNNTYSSVTISWDKIDGASGYLIYRSTDGKKWSKIKTLSNSYSSYTNTGLTLNKTYYYKIKTYRKIGTKIYYSSYSNTLTLKPYLNTTTVTGYNTYYQYAKISYTKVNGASGYKVFRSDSENGTYKTLGYTTSTNYYDKTAVEGKTYYYKVRPYRTINRIKKYGTTSQSASAMRANDSIIFTTVSNDYNSITLSINKKPDATTYYIYRATSKSGTYKLIKTLYPKDFNENTITYINTGLSFNKTYYYKIKIRNVNTSSYSSYKYAKTKIFKPTINVEGIESSLNRITWSKVNGTSAYEIYRSLDGKTYTKIKTTTNITFDDIGLVLGNEHLYKYKVRAYRKINGIKYYSYYSNIDSIEV